MDTLRFLQSPPPQEPPRFWTSPQGLRVAWTEYGDPDGNPVLYHHGWPSSRLQAALLHPLAAERGLRVIAIDRPGMGASSLVPGRRLLDWPPILSAFADAHGIGRFSQLGVSGGGPYVLACAAAMPDRLEASAVLCGAVPLADLGLHGLHPLYRLLASIRWLPASCFSPPLALASRIAATDPNKPPLRWLLHSLATVDRNLLLANPAAMRVLAASFQEGVRQGGTGVMTDAAIFVETWPIVLDTIQHPIHYWHGSQDRNIPADLARSFVSRVARAQLVVDPDEGHFSLALHRAHSALDWLAAARLPSK